MDEKIIKEARRILLQNYNATGGEYIPPSWPHYNHQWLWDSSFHAIAAMELGLEDLAKNEINQLFKSQTEKGFIPHQIYHGHFNSGDMERPLYRRGKQPDGTSLVGEPVLAQAIEAVGDNEFTQKHIRGLVEFYKYFYEYRDAKNVISIITPTESGRDSAPEFDPWFVRIMPKNWKNFDRSLLRGYLYYLEVRYFLMHWDEKKMLKSKLFNIKDVATHCIWIDGLYSLRRLLKITNNESLFPRLDEFIQEAKDTLIKNTWDDKTKTFYPVRVGKGKIKQLTLGGLFPLLIDDLPQNMVEAIVNHIKNPNEFWTKYPIPSVPVHHKEFSPDRSFPIWRGPVWINSNWFLIRGLMQHGYKEIAQVIARRTIEMVGREGFNEFYNPLTGKRLRENVVQDFGWTTLVVTLEKAAGLSP